MDTHNFTWNDVMNLLQKSAPSIYQRMMANRRLREDQLPKQKPHMTAESNAVMTVDSPANMTLGSTEYDFEKDMDEHMAKTAEVPLHD